MRGVLALGAVMLVAGSVWMPATAGVRMIDAHSQIARSVGWDKALALRDEAGIERVILSPLRGPDVRSFLAFASSHRDRIIPAIGLKPDRLRRGDRAALDQLERLGHRRVFGALSEAMILHAQKGRLAPQIVSTFDSPYARTALAIARRRHWPFVVHIEFGFAHRTNRYDTYMSGLESLLHRHPDLPVVLSHMGQLDVDGARRLIAAYPNIFFLTSHANPIFIGDHRSMGDRGSDQPWTDLFRGERLARGWRDLFIAHPDRFILAFDNVYDQDWSSHYVRQARLWRGALADLPGVVADAVAHGNAERLWHLSGGPETDADGQGDAREIVGPAGLTAPELIRRLDRDGDGRLGPDEFGRPRRIFTHIDADQDGLVTADELRAAWRAGAQASRPDGGIEPGREEGRPSK